MNVKPADGEKISFKILKIFQPFNQIGAQILFPQICLILEPSRYLWPNLKNIP